MMLVTGGVASGKRTYLRSLGYRACDMSGDADDMRSVLLDAQELVRDDDADITVVADRIADGKRAVAIVEVGCGIVPLAREERVWRDRAGLLARELADRSDVVVRMVCGIPVVLKGELPQGDGTCRS